jgi:trans-aconitate 2-methyltransferase
MAASTWNPDQYNRFRAERQQPFLDLVALVEPRPGLRVVDLGCGTGETTRLLHDRLAGADTLGLDNAETMLADSAAFATTGLRFARIEIAEFAADAAYDLILSNAALHWLPDHARLFPALLRKLTPRGTLAVQMPRNFLAPSHVLIGETALNGPWRSKVEHLVKPPPVEAPSFYHDLLAPLSDDVDIWETEYFQVLEGDNPVKEWTKGTWLTRYLDVLQGDEKAAFEAAYGERVARAYPKNAAGQTLFPFRRLFMVAQRKP